MLFFVVLLFRHASLSLIDFQRFCFPSHFDHVVMMFLAMCHGLPWHAMVFVRSPPDQVTVCRQLLELPWLVALEEKRWFVWPPSAMVLWHVFMFLCLIPFNVIPTHTCNWI